MPLRHLWTFACRYLVMAIKIVQGSQGCFAILTQIQCMFREDVQLSEEVFRQFLRCFTRFARDSRYLLTEH